MPLSIAKVDEITRRIFRLEKPKRPEEKRANVPKFPKDKELKDAIKRYLEVRR